MSIALDSQAALRPGVGLGISSFVLGAITTLSFIFLVVCAGVAHNNGTATPAFNTMIGASLMLVWIVNLIGVGLGIAGVVQRSSNKTFPILGLVLNFGILVLGAALVAAGLH
jgi:hypothetical protein